MWDRIVDRKCIPVQGMLYWSSVPVASSTGVGAGENVKSGVQSFTCLCRAQTPSPWSLQATEMTKLLGKTRLCSCRSGSFPYFLHWLCSFLLCVYHFHKKTCLLNSISCSPSPAGDEAAQVQSSAGFGQSVPVQLCAEQNSNLQEKIKKKKPTLRGVLYWLCQTGITTFQSAGTCMTAG